MKLTGIFSEHMKKYFDAEEGAYTAFTVVEIMKRTFNVKSVIRKMLIDKLGRENIPVVNETDNQDIHFEICDKAKIYSVTDVDIPCKFSKKDKDEMTIYFNTELIGLFNAEAGDTWYIYFRKNSVKPVIGIMSKDKWENLFDESEDDAFKEPDESGTNELNYTGEVTEMILMEEEAPERVQVQLTQSNQTVKSLSADQAALKEKNRKKKGNRGEEIAVEIEHRRLREMGRPDLISRIAHVSKMKDGLGYDLISTDIGKDGKEVEIYIEVKATSGDISMPFFVSSREVKVSQKYRELYYIYRIYEMTENKNSAKYYRLSGAIDDNYELTPTEYCARRS